MAEPSTAAPPPPTLSTASLPSAVLPPTPSSIASPATAPSSAVTREFLEPANPRKRPRQIASPKTLHPSGINILKSPTDTSPKSLLSPMNSPVVLTAAAEIAEQKKRKFEERDLAQQQSPNPQRSAFSALLGGSPINGMSRLQDAPDAVNTVNAAVAAIAPTISIPHLSQGDSSLQTSPVSMSSFGTADSLAAATTTTANGVQVASPGLIIEDEGTRDSANPLPSLALARADTEEGHSNKALTYPGPLLSAQTSDARRGMSLPGSNFAREDSKSPSSSTKKHKCPYCATEFTRHHNLKSHLLTHSHEKPYLCQTCDSRFRRLHDLKRHTKLHTGERPHICPKCKRSFARGDALARHNKGQGGCAGRRSSIGSYGGDGPGGDESMDGIMYTGQTSHEPETMDDDEEEDGDAVDDRGHSLPRIRRHDAPTDPHFSPSQDSQSGYQARQSSTYPPVAARQSTMRNLYPPSGGPAGGSSVSTSPGTPVPPIPQYPAGGSITSAFQIGGPNVFAQGSMTESPKPLSPGGVAGYQPGHPDGGIHRRRSPSLTQQFQQQHFGRRTGGRNSPPPLGLPPPMSNAPHLPSLPGLIPPDPRFTLPSQSAVPQHGSTLSQSSLPGPSHPSGGTGSYHSQHGGASSKSNSHSSHGTNPHGSGSGDRATLPYPQAEERIWAYVRALEAKIDRLHEEVTSLRSQMGGPPHR